MTTLAIEAYLLGCTLLDSTAANMATHRSGQTVTVNAQIPVKHSTRGEQHKPICKGGYLHRAVWEGKELQLAAM